LDNITHSLVGIALADCVSRRGATAAERRLSVGAAIIAANLPDVDLAYVGVAPAPLGYLLHHRGHTHTVIGVGALLLLLVVIYRRLPPVTKLRSGDRLRLWLSMALGLGSHIPLDALNSYGVHPFYPVDSSWYFGDAVFIFEPAFWVVLGLAAAWNARTPIARLVSALPIVIFPIAMVSMDIVPLEAAVVLAVAGALFAAAVGAMSRRARAGCALAACVVMIVGLVAASRAARHATIAALNPELRGRLVDVIRTPNPSSPLCWAVIGIELNERGGEYILWRGTLSLAPAWKDPATCASHRFAAVRGARTIGGGRLVLSDELHQSLGDLRARAERDCRVRAWLRFGRAPVVAGGAIFDLRFANLAAQNFSHMRLEPGDRGSLCPTGLPHWGMPRADILSR
jgi:inner membrane protein